MKGAKARRVGLCMLIAHWKKARAEKEPGVEVMEREMASAGPAVKTEIP